MPYQITYPVRSRGRKQCLAYLWVVHSNQITVRVIASLALAQMNSIYHCWRHLPHLNRLDEYMFVLAVVIREAIEDMTRCQSSYLNGMVLHFSHFRIHSLEARGCMKYMTRGEEKRLIV